MRIALFSEGIYPIKIGGIQKHSFLFAKYLASMGVYVDIFFWIDDRVDFKSLESIFSTEEKHFINLYSVQSYTSVYFPGHFLYESWINSKRIFKKYQQQDKVYNLIYVQGFSGMALLASKMRLSKHPTILLNFHGLEMFQKAADGKSKLQQYLFRPFVRYCLRSADFNISLGGKLTTIIKKESGNSSNVLELPIGIDEKWISGGEKTASHRRRFVFVGRFERRKGIEELNTVIQQILPKHPFQFDFIGPIPSNKRILHPSVTYHGLIKDENEIKRILQDADILVSPSWSEGMPTVILEAMASGCAIIATDVGAVSCLVSDKNGWLIQAGDMMQLKGVMLNSLELSQEELSKKQKNSIEIVRENYTWDKVIDLSLQTFAEVLKNNKSTV